MKKKVAVLLTLLILLSFCSVNAENTEPPCGAFCINDVRAVVNGEILSINKPLIIFNKVYVDLYDFSDIFGITVNWIYDNPGFFRAFCKEAYTDFHSVRYYDELKETSKFFVNEENVYVSVDELVVLIGFTMNYDGGVFIISKPDVQPVFDKSFFGYINTESAETYIYKAYPYPKHYTVYPYQKYSYEFMKADSEVLAKMSPELIKVSSIGSSVEGREIRLIEFGKGNKKIFVCGTHHAREYIATTYLMYAIDRYAYEYEATGDFDGYSVKNVLDNVTFCIVPMVNPDGVNLVQNGVYSTQNPSYVMSLPINEGAEYGFEAWKANVNGVDINWNYNKDWSAAKNKKPRGSTGFNGAYPNSEPETQAMVNYLDNNAFEAYVSFHTQGQIFYYAEDNSRPTGLDKLIKLQTGFEMYREDCSGTGGSFFDYVYRKTGKVTMTFELCNYIGNYPYPNEGFNSTWNPVKSILLLIGTNIMYR